MLRRLSLIAIAASMCSFSASAFASSAPSQAPVLTSSAFASPVTIHWAPATDAADSDDDGDGGEGRGGDDDDDDDDDDDAPLLQSVLRAPGPCTAPAAGGRTVAQFRDARTIAFSDPVPDGTYCYYIEVTDGSAAAASPGLTVVVDARARVAAGSGDLGTASSIPVTAPTAGVADKLAPSAPTRLTVSRVREKRGAVRVPLIARWANPAAADLARVALVVNRRHPPRSPADGRVVYRGKGRSAVLTLRAGQIGHFALYAVDHSGNVSAATRRRVSLVALLPLRPLSGSSLRTAPLLTWERKQGAAYYNLQVFRNGKRVLIAWPSRPSYRLPAAKLQKGTYVWFVWPALRAASASPKFANLIGRATFVYSP